jgi:hypothetical protein
MRKINMEIPPKVAGIGVIAITENDFILKTRFVVGTFFFYIRDLSIKRIIFALLTAFCVAFAITLAMLPPPICIL